MTSLVTTAQLAKTIAQNIKDENAGRVALFHYIKNTCRGDEEVTPNFINEFFSECLLLTMWQEKKSDLYNDVKNLLLLFNQSQYNFDQILDLQKTQILHLQNAENLYLAIKSAETQQTKEGETFRIIPDGEHRMVVLRRGHNGIMHVKTYGNTVRIQGKDIVPVKNDQELTYTPALELYPGVIQKIRLSPHTQVRFEVTESGTIAQTLSGFAFRQSQMVQLKHLSEFTPAFYHLKKLEKFYVYRPSDPFYMQLVQNLDSAVEKMSQQVPGTEAFARRTFEEAQIVFDQVFPDDKILFMKLKELAKYISFNRKDLQV